MTSYSLNLFLKNISSKNKRNEHKLNEEKDTNCNLVPWNNQFLS